MIIDAEVHLLHPDARKADFVQGRDEPVRKAIHEHPDFPFLAGKLSKTSLLSSMTQCHIDYACIMGMPWRDQGILRENNRYIADCVKKYPDKFRGFFIPNLCDITRAAQQIANLDRSVFLGVKLIPGWQGIHVNDQQLKPILQIIQEKKMFLMVHTDHLYQSQDGDTAFRLCNMLEHNPGLKVLAPHLGGLLCMYGLFPRIKRIMQNVTFIASVSATMQMVKLAAEAVPGQVVFGTDYPFNHCHDQMTPLRALLELGLPEEQLDAILAKTACTLLGLEYKKVEKR